MKTDRKLTLVLAVLVVAVFALALPRALRDALARGQFYLLTSSFFGELAPRLSGTGRLRFLIQPTMAILLGIRDGLADARAGRGPYLWSLLFGTGNRRELLRSAYSSIANLVLLAILLDSIFQWILFGVVYPGAALVIGPVLICAPYSVARALANRGVRVAGTEG